MAISEQAVASEQAPAVSDQAVAQVAAFGERLAQAGLAPGADLAGGESGPGTGSAAGRQFIALRLKDGRVVATRSGADLVAITSSDLDETAVAPAVAELFRRRPEVQAAALLASPYAVRVSQDGDGFRAALDDMAQIAGVSLRTARVLTASELLRCLRGRSACLVRGEGMLVTGRSLNEAFTTALVTEKGARTHVLGALFGGARPVPYLTAVLERFVYQKQYSRINLDDERARGDAP